MDYSYLIIIVGIFIVLDIGLDLLRLWNQAVQEHWMRRVDEKLEVIRVDLNGKAKQILDMAEKIADAAGYKRGREDQAAQERFGKNNG